MFMSQTETELKQKQQMLHRDILNEADSGDSLGSDNDSDIDSDDIQISGSPKDGLKIKLLSSYQTP